MSLTIEEGFVSKEGEIIAIIADGVCTSETSLAPTVKGEINRLHGSKLTFAVGEVKEPEGDEEEDNEPAIVEAATADPNEIKAPASIDPDLATTPDLVATEEDEPAPGSSRWIERFCAAAEAPPAVSRPPLAEGEEEPPPGSMEWIARNLG